MPNYEYDALINDEGVNEPAISKVPVVLCLDTSGSMAGSKIDTLNKSVERFVKECSTDDELKDSVELAIITFNSNAEIKQPFSAIKDINTENLYMTVSGTTNMIDGLKLSLEQLESRKSLYRNEGVPYFQPWLIIMSDGELDGGMSDTYLKIAAQVKNASKEKKLIVNPISFGDDSEKAGVVLKKLHPNSVYFEINQIEKFSAYFEWLKQSAKAISRSNPGEDIELDDPTKQDIFKIKA